MKTETNKGDSTCKINGGKVRALRWKDGENNKLHAKSYRRPMYKQRVNALFT
jgi:hypothetical protein